MNSEMCVVSLGGISYLCVEMFIHWFSGAFRWQHKFYTFAES